MADDVLSQAELETLLSSLESSTARRGQRLAGPCPAAHRTRPRFRAHELIVPRELDRSRSIAQPCKSLRCAALHEGVSRSFSAALSALLRTVVEVKLTCDRASHLRRVRGPAGESDLRQCRASGAAGGKMDSRRQSAIALSDDRSAAGRRTRAGADRAAAVDGNRTATRLAHHEAVLARARTGLAERRSNCRSTVDRVESNPRLVLSVPSERSRRAVWLRSRDRRCPRRDDLVPAGRVDRAGGRPSLRGQLTRPRLQDRRADRPGAVDDRASSGERRAGRAPGRNQDRDPRSAQLARRRHHRHRPGRGQPVGGRDRRA